MKTILITIFLLAHHIHYNTHFFTSRIRHATHLNVRIVKVIRVHRLSGENVTYQNLTAKYWDYVNYAKSLNPIGVSLVITGPIKQYGLSLATGIATVCTPNDGVGVVFFGNPVLSVHIMTHELGHLLGALHDTTIYPKGTSIMYPYTLPDDVNRSDINFSEKSTNEMIQCLQNNNFY